MKQTYETLLALFGEHFRADYARVSQLGAARKAAFLRNKGAAPELVTSARRTVEAWEFPALATETADDRKAIDRVRTVQKAERLYAGILGDASFRLTGPKAEVKAKAKAKAKVAPSRAPAAEAAPAAAANA